MTVWVDGWQQECCGVQFAVGHEVRWHLLSPDEEYLGPLFRPEDGVTVTYAEEHHQSDYLPPLTTAGTVTAIRAVQLEYAGEKVLYPVPGSARLTAVATSDGTEMRLPGFAGYLVELDAPASTRPS